MGQATACNLSDGFAMVFNLRDCVIDCGLKNEITEVTSRALMEGINMEKSSQGCYKAMQLSQ